MSDVGPPIDLPVLDISNPLDPEAGKALLAAATKYGFLYVDSRGTDFTAAEVDRAFELVHIPIHYKKYILMYQIIVQEVLRLPS